MNRKAFTLIELIFVIVIIGILAAVAIPRLSATRDDAKASESKKNLAICLTDIASLYTAKNIESTANNNDASDYSQACKMVVNDNCFAIDLSDFHDGNLTVKDINNGSNWCKISQKLSHHEGLSAPAPGKLFSFGGSQIKP